jgi:hypothetical protein
VQASPSLQVVPSALAGLEQAPRAESQVPGSWHWSSAVHTTGLPEQRPAWQESPVVQASPSVQAVPSGLAGLEQAPVVGVQVPGS